MQLTRDRLLPAGLGLVVVSLVLSALVPPSFNPESRLVVLGYDLAHVTFWLGMLCLAAAALDLVLSAAATTDASPLAQRVATASDGALLGTAGVLVVVSILVRVLVTGSPGVFTHVDQLLGQVGSTCFWVGLLLLALWLARGLLAGRAR